MKGNFFTEVIDGQVAIQGFIVDQVGLGFYKVAFIPQHPQKAFSKIIPVERMVNFVLFATKEEMDEWLASMQPPAPLTAAQKRAATRKAKKAADKLAAKEKDNA